MGYQQYIDPQFYLELSDVPEDIPEDPEITSAQNVSAGLSTRRALVTISGPLIYSGHLASKQYIFPSNTLYTAHKTLDSCLDSCAGHASCTGIRFYNKGSWSRSRCFHYFHSCVMSKTCRRYQSNRDISMVHYHKTGTGCVNAKSQRCSDTGDISSGGFPFSIAGADTGKSKKQMKDDAIFPCDVSRGIPKGCRGSVSCATPDIPLCGGACGGLVTGHVSGSGSWDCADDLSSCEGSIAISGGVNVGIPNCKWCPPLLGFSVTYARTMGIQACCSGPFAYTTDSIELIAPFAVVVIASMKGTFYEMAARDDYACRTSRPNWIQNDLRKMVIAGKVEICFGFCFSIVSGNLYMVPEVPLPKSKTQKKSGQCCLLVDEWASSNSCGYCPGSHKPAWPPTPWSSGCWGSRRCK